MSAFYVALALGAAAGVIGAIPPGPLTVALVHRVSERQSVRALFAGLGGAVVHLVICVAVAFAACPVLASLAATVRMQTALCLACIAFGVVLARIDLFTASNELGVPHEEPALTNRVLIAKWIFVIGALVWSGAIAPGLTPALAFAAGVWLGIAGWFCALVAVARVARAGRVEGWGRRLTLAGAVLIALLGVYGTLRASGWLS